MSYISTGVEYALHSLLLLAQSREQIESVSVGDLATLQRLSPDFLAKIFTKLQRASIVEATEGAKGGFRLGRSPSLITVLDVVRAVDGSKPMFKCQDIRTQCRIFGRKAPAWAVKGRCSIHAIMIEAEKRALEVLATRTLADIVDRLSSKAPKAYGEQILEWFKNGA